MLLFPGAKPWAFLKININLNMWTCEHVNMCDFYEMQSMKCFFPNIPWELGNLGTWGFATHNLQLGSSQLGNSQLGNSQLGRLGTWELTTHNVREIKTGEFGDKRSSHIINIPVFHNQYCLRLQRFGFLMLIHSREITPVYPIINIGSPLYSVDIY